MFYAYGINVKILWARPIGAFVVFHFCISEWLEYGHHFVSDILFIIIIIIMFVLNVSVFSFVLNFYELDQAVESIIR